MLRASRGPVCRRCGTELPPGGGERLRSVADCGRCRTAPPPFAALFYVAAYEPPVAEVVRALKFHRARFLGRHLAREILSVHGGSLRAADVVAPVPLSPLRQLSRGYNQAEAIARPLARSLGLPHRPLLRRRLRPPQVGLGRDRRLLSPAGSFRPRRRLAAAPTVLLVDDVVTTGATLRAAAEAVLRAGAGRVLAVAFARTPDPRRPAN